MKDRDYCAAHNARRTCSNGRTLGCKVIKARVMLGLYDGLMALGRSILP